MKFAKQILLTLAIIVTTAALAACGNNDNGYSSNGDANGVDATPSPTPPAIVIHQQEITTGGATGAIIELSREHFLEDFDQFVSILENDFLHLGVVYRRFGVDFLQIAAELRPIIADDDFELDEYIFEQLLLDNFFLHPDISFPIADWHINGTQRRPSEASGRSTTPHAESSVIEPDRIGYVRINCFMLEGFGSGAVRSNIGRAIAQMADFEHIIIDIRGADGRFYMWDEVLYLAFITEQMANTYHVFARDRDELNTALMMNGQSQNIDIQQHDDVDERGLQWSFELTWLRNPPEHDDGHSNFGGQLWLLIDGETSRGAATLADNIKHSDIAILVGEPVGGNTTSRVTFLRLISNDLPPGISLTNTRIEIGFEALYVTNHLGQNVDEYVARPHYYNMEGLDALETALALIAAADAD